MRLKLIVPFFVDGYEFFCSANNVILCAGNAEGILPASYFAQVTDHRTGTIYFISYIMCLHVYILIYILYVFLLL